MSATNDPNIAVVFCVTQEMYPEAPPEAESIQMECHECGATLWASTDFKERFDKRLADGEFDEVRYVCTDHHTPEEYGDSPVLLPDWQRQQLHEKYGLTDEQIDAALRYANKGVIPDEQ